MEMSSSETELASTLWLQLVIMGGLTVITYILMEIWRNYLFFGCWMVIIVDICLFPFIFGTHSPFFTAKWLMLPPVLLVCSLWRISYVELKENENFCRKILIIPSQFLCRTKGKEKKSLPPSKIMEWFWSFILWINIITAVIQGFLVGSIMNAICGVLLAFSIPFPAKILYPQHSYFINTENEYYDWYVTLSPLWIISYTSWNFCFLWQYAPFAIYWCSLHLGPCFIAAFIRRDYKIYLQLRLFCLSLVAWIHTPSAEHEGIIPWVLDGDYFKNIMIFANKSINFEIWGAFNMLIAMIHIIKWIQWIKVERKKKEECDHQFQEQAQLI